jgi:hypothetical protein
MSKEVSAWRTAQPATFVLSQFIDEQCDRLQPKTRARYLRILGRLSSHLETSAAGLTSDQLPSAIEAFFAALASGTIVADEADLQGARTIEKKLITWLQNEGYL